MRTLLALAAFLGGLWAALGVSNATSLQAAPVLIEFTPAGGATSVSLRNIGRSRFDVQTRIFRWTQKNGQDVLEETEEVVTSPPVATLDSGATYAVRLVRLDNKPVGREEAYRLLVDQLPDEEKMRGGTVSLVMRHSIPVFILPDAARAPKLDWRVSRSGSMLKLHVRNEGGRRVRLSGVSVKVGGTSVKFGNGLLGYVLAGSEMVWQAPLGGAALGGTAQVSATTDAGPVNAPARLAR